MDKKSFWQGFAVMSGIFTLLTSFYYGFIQKPINYIPAEINVQQGFAIPNKLEIKLQDLDGNGKKEVIMKYDKKSYLLKLDKQGNPIVLDYKVMVEETVPKQ